MRQPARPREDRGDWVGRGVLTPLVGAVVPRDGPVRRLRLHGFAVGRQQHRRHQPERAEALRHRIRLDVAVVVLGGPDEAAGPLHRLRHEIVDQPVLVLDPGLAEAPGELLLEDLLKDLEEAAVVDLEDRVLGRQVDRPAALQAVVQAGAREVADRGVEVEHPERHAGRVEVVHLVGERLAPVPGLEGQGQRPRPRDRDVGRAVLVAEGVAADHDRLLPPRHEPGHVPAEDRLAEDRPPEDVANGAVGRSPHPLQAELLDAILVGRDRGALDAHAVLPDRVRRLDRDAVVAGVARLDAEVVVTQVELEVGEDQPLPDPAPHDSRHLVAVELDQRTRDPNLLHAVLPPRRAPRRPVSACCGGPSRGLRSVPARAGCSRASSAAARRPWYAASRARARSWRGCRAGRSRRRCSRAPRRCTGAPADRGIRR